MRPKLLLALILCNLVWSAHPLMGKWMLESVTPAQGAWLRYATAFVAYVAASRLLGTPLREQFPPARRRREWGWSALMGLLAFALSPLLMLTGLRASRAVDNALIVAMEPLLAVMLAAWLVGERVGRRQAAAFAAALAGFALLSGLGPATLARGLGPESRGNLLILASLGGEAAYSAIGRKLAGRLNAARIYGAAAACGALLLTGAMLARGFPDPRALSARAWCGVLWTGPLGTAVCYLFWIRALREATVTAVAVTLFVQPLMGALWGALFLGEWLSFRQLLGAGLILAAVAAQAIRAPSARPRPSSRSRP